MTPKFGLLVRMEAKAGPLNGPRRITVGIPALAIATREVPPNAVIRCPTSQEARKPCPRVWCARRRRGVQPLRRNLAGRRLAGLQRLGTG
jgi:hypothetical protein